MNQRWRMRARLLLLIVATAGCSARKLDATPAESASSPPASPPVDPSSAPSLRATTEAVARQPPAPPTVEADTPALGCADPSPFCFSKGCVADETPVWPRACVVRGRVKAVRRAAARVHARDGEAIAALVIELDPAEDPGCVTPLDEAAGKLAEPEAGYADKVTATKIELVGANRLEPELRVGRPLCGWVEGGSHEPLYGPPSRWEGQISDADGTLLVAASAYFDPSASKMLAQRFRFTREGTPTRERIDEGGWFLHHPSVRIRYGGTSVVVREGEQRVPMPDRSHLALRAGSLLNVGPVPVFTGRWDGYSFSALRVPGVNPPSGP